MRITFIGSGLANFTQAEFAAAGFGQAFYNNLVQVAKDEATQRELPDGRTDRGQRHARCRMRLSISVS